MPGYCAGRGCARPTAGTRARRRRGRSVAPPRSRWRRTRPSGGLMLRECPGHPSQPPDVTDARQGDTSPSRRDASIRHTSVPIRESAGLGAAEAAQGGGDGFAYFRRLRGDGARQEIELTAQGVNLVDQADDGLDRVVVEADVALELGQQADARD